MPFECGESRLLGSGLVGRLFTVKGKSVCIAILSLVAISAIVFYISWRAEERQWRLTQAAHDGDLALVKRLVDKGAKLDATPGDQNVFGEPALLEAASEGHDDIVSFFLDHGANINLTDSCKNTAINCAVIGGHLSTVQLLLSRGANPNIWGEGYPLGNAENRNDENMIELLKAHGAKEQVSQ
jgi:ankyrin repeat protein